MELISSDATSITLPLGFVADAAYCGLKTPRPGVLDVGLIASEVVSSAAGVFTTNRVAAAPVIVSRGRIANGQAQAVVFNSGNANACTGHQGVADALAQAQAAADLLGIPSELVLVASTGIIGVPLDMDKLLSGIRSLRPTSQGGSKVPRAMMTTDTTEKVVAVRWSWKGRIYLLAGVAKGAGMIYPNMATMLAFFTCDAPVEHRFLADTLKAAVDETFNMISVDGDTSTNDTVLILANGLAGGDQLGGQAPREANASFEAALRLAAMELAKAIVRDGEGSTRVMEVLVQGGRTKRDARLAARAVTSSNLVKAALFGSDPNWGRILAAVGYSGADFDPGKVEILIGTHRVAMDGKAVAFDREAAAEAMKGPEVRITIDLHDGQASALAWGCDLTPDYVLENSQYTT